MHNAIRIGQVLAINAYPGNYTLLRIAAPECARRIQPGQYLEVNSQPWPVMRAGPKWVDCLQRSIQNFSAGTEVRVAGPLGTAFVIESATPRALLLGGESGIAPLVFLTDILRNRRPRVKPLLLLSSERPFPFKPQPSRIMIPGLPGWVIAAMPLLEDWSVPSRLASSRELPGCFNGGLAELARGWLDVSQGVADVTVYACGPADVLAAARQLAAAYGLPCQTVAGIPGP